MVSCLVCHTDVESSQRFCKTCGWDLLGKETSDSTLMWAHNSWKKNQELECQLEKSYQECQKLKTEKEELISKVEDIYKQLVEKSAEERERQSLILLSKLDELVNAVKLSRQFLSGLPQVENQSKKGTVESIDLEEAVYRKNPATIPSSDTTQQKPQEAVTLQDLPEVESESHKAIQHFELTPEEQELAKIYNEKDKILLEYIIKVSPTQDSIEKQRLAKTTKLFSKNPKGTYWIVINKYKNIFLIPDYNFKFNEFNYQFLKAYFTCDDDWQNEGSELKILKAARVKPLDQGGEKWELVDKGVIEFTFSKEVIFDD